MRGRNWQWAVAIVVAVLVLIGSLLPGGIGWAPFRPPVVTHVLAYLLLGFLLSTIAGGRLSGALSVAAVLTLSGLLIELLQTQIPPRSFLWADVLGNALGALVGSLFAWCVAALSGRLKKHRMT